MYQFQWPAGRPVTNKVLVEVSSVGKDRGRLFGLLNSPSFADRFEDGMIVKGRVVEGALPDEQAQFALRIPASELFDVRKGAMMAVGLSATNDVICVAEGPETTSADGRRSWLDRWHC